MPQSNYSENTMRLICPSCAAQYAVESSTFPEDGRIVQCFKCQKSWFHQTPDSFEPKAKLQDNQSPAGPSAAPHPSEHKTDSSVTAPQDEDDQLHFRRASVDDKVKSGQLDPALVANLRQEAAESTEIKHQVAAQSDEAVLADMAQKLRKVISAGPTIQDPAQPFKPETSLAHTNSVEQDAKQNHPKDEAVDHKPRNAGFFRLAFMVLLVGVLTIIGLYQFESEIVSTFPQSSELLGGLSKFIDERMMEIAGILENLKVPQPVTSALRIFQSAF